ncbi:MAG: hypothetical protein ONB48_16595 [candidate division KSB1 bacterium]|nr:hypothetical protein [candidate division KSB1 bacterium]MDZ7274208.1 hypothetical protein [candidate division KSB1 bacterium]MDZ7287270.1 hypothetical protein [candidate division KSB1 bacterium]MDZ7296806.1 hypothetical protein [candidate division KSB1 bacterium]MDZ7308441.1 hypothetical protein [candidate division KSB1 bacterium]
MSCDLLHALIEQQWCQNCQGKTGPLMFLNVIQLDRTVRQQIMPRNSSFSENDKGLSQTWEKPAGDLGEGQ